MFQIFRSAHLRVGPRPSFFRAALLGWVSALLLTLGACGGGGGGGGGGSAPGPFTYSQSPVLYNLGIAIAPNVPSANHASWTWSVLPALPAGLTLDPVSGEITGTPTAEAAAQVYVVTATNAQGSSGFDLDLGTVRPVAYALASSIADQSISTYTVDPVTGDLVPHGYALPTPGRLRPSQLTPARNGQAVFVPYQDSDHLVTFQLDPATGQLEQTASLNTGDRPMHFVMHPTADVAYLALSTDNQIATYTVDPNTHALTEVLPRVAAGTGPQHLAIDPTGSFLYAVNTIGATVSAFTIDAGTQQLTHVGTDPVTGVSPSDLAITRNGKFLYVVNSRGHSVSTYSLDTLTGEATLVGTGPVGQLPIQMDLDPTGRFLYVVISGEDLVRGYGVDQDTGDLDSLGAGWAVGGQPVTVRTDAAGQLLYVGNNDTDDLSSFRVDSSNGDLTPLMTTRTRDLPLNVGFLQGNGPLQVSAQYAFVANRTSQDISKYAANGAGTLVSSLPTTAAADPRSLALDPFNRFLFVPDTGGSAITSFPVTGTGDLGAGLPAVGTDSGPVAIAVDASGRFLVTANSGSGTLSSFSYDAAGALTGIGNPAAAGTPRDVVYDPTGRFVFSANGTANTISRYSAHPVTGVLTELLPATAANGQPRALAVSPSGRFLYVALETIDTVATFSIGDNGSLTLSSSVATGDVPSAVAFDPTGEYAYVTNHEPAGSGSVSMYSVNRSSGVLTGLGPVLAGANPLALEVDRDGGFVYVVNESSADVDSFSLNRFSGALTLLSSVPTGTDPAAIAVSFQIQ